MIDLPPPDENAKPFPEVAAERSGLFWSRLRLRRKEEEEEEAEEEAELMLRRPVLFWTPPPPPPMILPVSGSKATAKALGPEVAVEASAETGERREEERTRAFFFFFFLKE